MLSRKLRLAFLLVAGALGIAAAQTPSESPGYSRVEKKAYFFKEAATEMDYLIFVSSRYRQGEPTPLIVALHGSGSSPNEIIYIRGLTGQAEQRGYIVVAPWGLNAYGGYGNRQGRSDNRPNDPENAGELSELDVMNVLAIVRKEYSIDARRIYLLGHSMGGSGAVYLAAKYPELWAGLALFAPGGGATVERLALIRSKPVILYHGQMDRNISVRASRTLAEGMKTLGMTYEYHEISGGDHSNVVGYMPQNVRRVFEFFEDTFSKP